MDHQGLDPLMFGAWGNDQGKAARRFYEERRSDDIDAGFFVASKREEGAGLGLEENDERRFRVSSTRTRAAAEKRVHRRRNHGFSV